MNGMRKFTTTYYKLSSNGKFLEGNGFVWRFICDLHNMEFGPDNTVLKAVIDEAAPDQGSCSRKAESSRLNLSNT